MSINYRRIAILAIIPLLFLSGLSAKPVSSVVRNVSGTVEYAEPGSNDFRTLRRGMRLEKGCTIRTGPNSTAILRVTPGAAMRVSPDTTVVLDEMFYNEENGEVKTRRAQVNLKEGTVSSLLKKKEASQTDFRIKTPQGAAAARGTFYGVTVQDGQTFISVKEGKVGLKLDKDQ